MNALTNPMYAIMVCILALSLSATSCMSMATNRSATSGASKLILATTTSTQDSGLLDLLIPIFEGQSGHSVQTIAVGTGAALKMAEEGNADVLLVHAPEAEMKLVDAGIAKERWLIMHNDFVIVGPQNDPAGITEATSTKEGFARIAATGANFVSRGDDSGTNKKELSIWQELAADPNATKPTWYIESGQGMGTSLVIASEKSAYTLTDRATYLATQQNLDLDIFIEGDPVLLNIYHVITVNPDKWAHVNYDGSYAFASFMVSKEVQNIIAEFGIDQYGQPLFFPDAGTSVEDLGQQ